MSESTVSNKFDKLPPDAKKLKQKAKGTLSMDEIQEAIDQGRP